MVLEIRSYVRIAILLYQQYFQLSVATFLIAGVCLLQELHSFTGTSPQHCGRRVQPGCTKRMYFNCQLVFHKGN